MPTEADEADVRMSDDDENGPGSDSDSDMDDAGDELDAGKLLELDERLRVNPFDYQAHVDKISLLKSAGELVTSSFIMFLGHKVKLKSMVSFHPQPTVPIVSRCHEILLCVVLFVIVIIYVDLIV